MFRRISTAPTPVNYPEIAGNIDFASLQRDLQAAARLTIVGAALTSGVAIGMASAALMLDLHALGFAIACIMAGGIPFALAIFWTRRLTKYKPTWTTLESIVHQEWKTGINVLPEWFAVPRMYRRLRSIPKMSEGQLTKLRRANLVLSIRFQVACIGVILIGLVFGIDLIFRGLRGLVVALPILIPGLIIIGSVASLGPNIHLLYELREYEKVTGRTVLPADLTGPGRPAKG